MIDNKTGNIGLADFYTKLNKGMTVQNLQESFFYKRLNKSIRDMNNGYIWYDFNSFIFLNYNIVLSLCFFNDTLSDVHFFTVSDTDSENWVDWTEEEQIKIFERNTKFLKLILNQTPKIKLNPYPSCGFIFKWGTVWSEYDSKSASSIMGIRYK